MTRANLQPKDAVKHDQVKALGSISESSEHLGGHEAHEVLGRLKEEILKISGAKQVDFLYQGGEGLAFKLTMNEGVARFCKVMPVTRLVDLMTTGHDLKEAVVLKRVNHPGLAKFDQVVDISDGFYKVLIREYIDGESLRERFNKDGRLSPEKAEAILRATLEILVALEEQGVTHQDIKPEHIILTPEGDVKLIDFGLAHIRSDKMQSTRSFAVGTLAYCNFDFNHNPSRDLYALGVALTEALFTQGKNDSERIGENDLPGYMKRDFIIPSFPGLSDRLRIVLQKMRAEKDHGFKSAREALEALNGMVELVDPAIMSSESQFPASRPLDQLASLYLRRLSALVGESVLFDSVTQFRKELRSISSISQSDSEGPGMAERLSNLEKVIDRRLEGLRSTIDKFEPSPSEPFDFIGYVKSTQEFRILAALREQAYEVPAGALRSREFAKAAAISAHQGMLPLLEQIEPIARGAAPTLGKEVPDRNALFSKAALGSFRNLLRHERDGIASYMEQIVTNSSLSVNMVGIANNHAARPPSILTELKDWFLDGSGIPQQRTGYSFYLVSPEGSGNSLKLAIELLTVRKYNGRLNSGKLFSAALLRDEDESGREISITRRWFGLGPLPECVVHVTRKGEDYHHFVPGVKLEFRSAGGSRDFNLSTTKRSVNNGFLAMLKTLKALAVGFNKNVSWSYNDWPVAALYSCVPTEMLLETHVETLGGEVVPMGRWEWPQPGQRVPFQRGKFILSDSAPMYFYNVVALRHVETREIGFRPRDPSSDGLGNPRFEHKISENDQLAIAKGALLGSGNRRLKRTSATAAHKDPKTPE